MLDQQSVSVREIARFVGKTTATMKAIPLAPLHYRALQSLMNSVLPPELHSGGCTRGDIHQIQNSSITNPSQHSRLGMVDSPQKGSPWCTSLSSGSNNNSALRCIQQKLGCGTEWSITDGRSMVSRGGNSPHKLPRVASSLSGYESIWEGVAEHHSPTANGNITAVSYINQKGGTVSQPLCQLTLTIWTWRVKRNITLLAEHLPGQLNW